MRPKLVWWLGREGDDAAQQGGGKVRHGRRMRREEVENIFWGEEGYFG
jgi:hypothetical protein